MAPDISFRRARCCPVQLAPQEFQVPQLPAVSTSMHSCPIHTVCKFQFEGKACGDMISPNLRRPRVDFPPANLHVYLQAFVMVGGIWRVVQDFLLPTSCALKLQVWSKLVQALIEARAKVLFLLLLQSGALKPVRKFERSRRRAGSLPYPDRQMYSASSRLIRLKDSLPRKITPLLSNATPTREPCAQGWPRPPGCTA